MTKLSDFSIASLKDALNRTNTCQTNGSYFVDDLTDGESIFVTKEQLEEEILKRVDDALPKLEEVKGDITPA